MYAILVEDSGCKDIVEDSLCERSDETLESLKQLCEEWKAMFPECNYYIVKIDYEVMK